MQQIFHGIAVSPGVVEGIVYLIDKGSLKIPKYWIHDRELNEELQRYEEALLLSKDQVRKLKEKLSHTKRREHALILEAHLAMLDDILLTQDTANNIRNEKINAEWALEKTQKKLVEAISNIDEEYLRERSEDISHVINRVLNNLLGKSDDSFRKIDKAVILVTHDLSPVDLAHMPRQKILGFATDVGGRTSHVGIVAASMEIPAVLGVENLTQYTHSGDRIIIDGVHGVIVINPTAETVAQYQELDQHYKKNQESLIAERDLPSETHDHRAMRFLANMEFPEEIPFIIKQGAQGVGLLRTEFLFLNSKMPPTEEEQFLFYKQILEAFKPNPVTMRTYDLGGDKSRHSEASDLESNPALGLRAIRYCLREPELFRSQIRAMFRASPFGNLKLMFPLISDLSELLESKKIARDVLNDLRKKKIPVADSIPIGIMVETPAAAMIVDMLAPHVEFFSVGTNDLIQYTLAVDRSNEHVAYLYNPLHPAILQMLQRITESARKHNIPVNLCGEMASDPLFLPILVAMGFDELSMNAAVLPNIKHILRSLDIDMCQEIFGRIVQSQNSEESLEMLKKEMATRFPDYFEL